MMDTESRWSEALTSNIRSIIRWLKSLPAEGDKVLPAFSCWVQRTSEFAKKELITLCFSRCHGLWMFLDRNSFTKVHLLLQRLRNLLTLAQWARQHHYSAHLWHGVGVPCSICGAPCGPDVRRGCWSRAHRVLKQHIWLGQLVQWWGLMGLLPKFPEAQEVKRIAQMWRDMEHSHRKACLDAAGEEEKGSRRFGSLIQGMVMHLDRQRGCVWTSAGGGGHCYPPPDLQALLKLVLLPRVDNASVQAIFMYFVQDVANFLQCKDDLLQSFCHAFTVPPGFSQQVKAFWMFDHGHIKASMEVLLSPRAWAPCLSWQHHCIIHCLLSRKQPQVALRYLQWTRPAIQTPEDAKLCADVLLQCSCVSEAWTLLKKVHTDSEDLVQYFLWACEGSSLCVEALQYIPAGYHEEENYSLPEAKDSLLREEADERPPCPLSARLYQAQRARAVSSDDLVRLARRAAAEVRKPRPRKSEVVWPKRTEEQAEGGEISLSALSLSPSSMDQEEDKEQITHVDDPEWEAPVIQAMLLEKRDFASSPEDPRSVSASSFASASSPSPLKRQHAYVYERTLTLQRISSLLTDGENPSSDEEEEGEDNEDEEESETLSSSGGSQSCSEPARTPDGARGSDSPGNICNNRVMLSGEEEDVFSEGEDFSVRALSGPPTDENLPNKRSDSQSQLDFNPESQSVPGSHLGEGSSCDAVHSVSQQHPSERLASPTASRCVLERQLQQKPRQLHRQDKLPLRQDSSSDASETTQDVLADPSRSMKEPMHGDQKSAPFSSITPAPAESASPSLNPDSACSDETTPAPSVGSGSKPEEVHVSSTLAWFDRGGVDGWKKEGSDVPSGEASAADRRPSFALSQSYTCSLGHFMDFTAKQKGDHRDGRQAEREEAVAAAVAAAGWGNVGRVSQGAMRSGRTAARKGKRLKRT